MSERTTINWRRMKRLGRTPLTANEMSIAGLSRGDARKGEMEVSDGATDCADCGRIMPFGVPVYWACSMEMECDPYCTACARERSQTMQAVCEAIEADYQAGRLAL